MPAHSAKPGSLGVFASLDMVFSNIFFGVNAYPDVFPLLVSGVVQAGRATVKFFIYTLVGHSSMLVALLYLGFHAGDATTAVYSLPTATTRVRIIRSETGRAERTSVPGIRAGPSVSMCHCSHSSYLCRMRDYGGTYGRIGGTCSHYAGNGSLMA